MYKRQWIGQVEKQDETLDNQAKLDHGTTKLAKDRANDGRVMRGYMRLVTWCLNHRWVTLFGAIAFFVGSVMLIPLLPTGFVPPPDTGQTQVV